MGTPSEVEAYVVSFPPRTAELLRLIQDAVTDEVPTGTLCISYGIPTLDVDGRHLVHWAGYERHVAVYPANDLPSDLRRRLEPYLSGKATARFVLDAELPLDLVRGIVRNQLRRRQDQAQQ